MFDGLKDKLTSFTSDVEEDAEVETPESGEASGETEDGETSGANGDGETSEESESEERRDAKTAESGSAGLVEENDSEPDGAVASSGDDDRTETGDGVGTAAPDQVPDEGGAGDQAEGRSGETATEPDQEGGGRGLATRAKLLATGRAVIDEDDLQSHLEELEFALLGSDVELSVAREILDGVEENLAGETRQRLESTGNIVQDAVREAVYGVISVGQFDFEERIAEADKPVTIIFTGVNGVGKTTTIAKLSHYLEQRGYSSVLANGDTYRAGANEQLEQHADNLGTKVISHEQGSDPAAVIYDAVEFAEANGVDVVLGDTAGRLHTSEGLMDQLTKIDRVIDPEMTIFVDEAVAGQDAVNRAREFDDAAAIDGTVLTKADADQQGGAAISIAHVTGKPILFLGTGQDYDDVELFDPERIVDTLLGESE